MYIGLKTFQKLNKWTEPDFLSNKTEPSFRN